MKRSAFCLLLSVIILIAGPARAAEERGTTATLPLTVGVDPRIELVSIIFRLAGNSEYNQCRIASYDHDLKTYFASWQNHACVVLARSLREKYGVSYDAPMSLAVRLPALDQWREGAPPTLTTPKGLDGRWRPEDVKEFLARLQAFRADSHFNEFFKQHEALFKLTTERAQQMACEARLEWFEKFFGIRPGARFHLTLGLTNGPCCYGVSTRLGDQEELYSILGVWESNWLGQPKFSSGMIGTVIHEFGHSYSNPIVSRHMAALKSAGERIFPHVQTQMRQQAYGSWQTMMLESLNRAVEVRYEMSHGGPEAAKRAIAYNVGRGFAWTGGLADLLGQKYEGRRDQYPTLDAFFPKIAAFFNEYNQKMEKAQVGVPRVVKTIPAADQKDVDPALRELAVVFDRDMKQGPHSWSWTGDGKRFPKQTKGNKPVWRDARTCTLAVELEPGRSYFFGINGGDFTNFRALDGTPAEPVAVSFTTRPANGK